MLGSNPKTSCVLTGGFGSDLLGGTNKNLNWFYEIVKISFHGESVESNRSSCVYFKV
jgi:hypothetical protein